MSEAMQQHLSDAVMIISMCKGIMKGELSDCEARTDVYSIEGLFQTEKN